MAFLRAGHTPKGIPTCCRTHMSAFDAEANTPPMERFRFVVCNTCGNKRCPKATDCALECTNSNAAGQKGSVYA